MLSNSLCHASSPPRPVPGGRNAFIDGADPDITIANALYWIYPTHKDGLEETSLFAYSSPDLKQWTRHGPVLKMADIAWIKEDGASRHFLWAPGIFQRAGKFYLYFSVGPQRPTPSRIGVAVADHPQGPFHDSGRPLLTGGRDFEAIDAMVFEDPRSRKVYLYCGGSAGARLRVFELSPNPISLGPEIPVKTPPFFTEAAFMHFRNGRYYLSYSHGRYIDNSYSVHYCVAPSPTGPWEYKGKILAGDRNHHGPGHHAFFSHPTTKEDFIVYHRWNGAGAMKKRPASRSLAIERLFYDAQGFIRPVVMTDTGVSPSPLR